MIVLPILIGHTGNSVGLYVSSRKAVGFMPFIEMTGRMLEQIADDGELHHESLQAAGVTDQCIVRVNQQGDIEVRRKEGWDVIGGLLGDFQNRVRRETGLNWA